MFCLSAIYFIFDLNTYARRTSEAERSFHASDLFVETVYLAYDLAFGAMYLFTGNTCLY